MIFKQVQNQLRFIAKKGNRVDIMNTMALLCAFSRTYGTGRVPQVRMLRGGKEASAVAGLQSTMVGATGSANAIHDYNLARLEFYDLINTYSPGIYTVIDEGQFDRMCIMPRVDFPQDVVDCEGTLLGTAANVAEFLNLWNNVKVDADAAICDVSTPYLIYTGVGYFIKTIINPNNASIIYNAPAPTKHAKVDEYVRNREGIGQKETQVKPKSVTNFSADNI